LYKVYFYAAPLFIFISLIYFQCNVIQARSIEEIKKEKIIKIGCSRVPPAENLKDSNIPYYMGFDIELALNISKELEKKLDVKTQWVATPRTDQRIPFLKDGQADLIIRTFSITPKRMEMVDFSKPYFDNPGLTIVVPDEIKDVRDFRDLAGKKVIVTGKSTSEYFVLKNIPKVKILPVANDEYAVDYLLKGRADAYVQDFSMCLFHVFRFNNLRLAGEPFNPGDTKDQYAVGMAKNSTELKKLVDSILDNFEKTGVMKDIYQKWYGDKMARVRKVTPLYGNYFKVFSGSLAIEGVLEEKKEDFLLFKTNKGESYFIPFNKIDYLVVSSKPDKNSVSKDGGASEAKNKKTK
jgi:ABC-type amino acid transport substrate-binding protein